MACRIEGDGCIHDYIGQRQSNPRGKGDDEEAPRVLDASFSQRKRANQGGPRAYGAIGAMRTLTGTAAQALRVRRGWGQVRTATLHL